MELAFSFMEWLQSLWSRIDVSYLFIYLGIRQVKSKKQLISKPRNTKGKKRKR